MVSATALSLIGQGAALATSLVATPFVIRQLGPAQYGFLALVTSILSYLVLADLGMGMAATRFASDALARDNEDEEVAVVWNAAMVTVLPALVAACALWIAAGSVADALHLPHSLHHAGVVSLRLAAIAGVARITGNIFNTPQLARLRWSTFILVNSGTGVAQVALTPIVLLIWHSVIAAAAVIAGTSLLAATGQIFFSYKAQPKLFPPRFHGAPLKALVAFGGALLVSGLANVPLYNAAQFLLARLASVREVAYYAVALTVASLLSVGPLALSQPLLPALTRARRDRAAIEHVYRLAMRLLALWIPPIATLLFFAAHPVIRVWAGPRYAVNSTDAFYILLGGVVLSILDYGPQTVLEAYGRTRILARFRLLELVPYIGLTYLLISALGLTGAALAWSLRFVVEVVALSIVAWRIARLSPSGLVSGGRRHAVALAVLILPPALAFAIGVADLAALAIAVVSAAAHAVLVWRTVLTREERARVSEGIDRVARFVPGAGAWLGGRQRSAERRKLARRGA
jgi:O-antigen/teichoic acid export membrane protein